MNTMHFQNFIRFLVLVISTISVVSAGNSSDDAKKIRVRFYGEAGCPMCRKFVTQVWMPLWTDLDFREFLDYDFVSWGNAYFATDACGSGPYDPQERACWYQHCIDPAADGDKACFGSDTVVYQHGPKEGHTDIYETCIKKLFGLETAVDFTYCAEGPNLDDDSLDAKALMTLCASKLVPNKTADLDRIQQCLEDNGRELEIENAKQTPTHTGVPYILVGDKPVSNFVDIKKVICSRLREKEGELLPIACKSNFLVSHIFWWMKR